MIKFTNKELKEILVDKFSKCNIDVAHAKVIEIKNYRGYSTIKEYQFTISYTWNGKISHCSIFKGDIEQYLHMKRNKYIDILINPN